MGIYYLGREGEKGGTCLHGQKTRPGIIGTAITESRHEAEK